MRPLTRLLAGALLAALVVSSAAAADKDEDKAKEAVLAFVKAVNARDVDAMMKLVDVPFVASSNGKNTVFEKAEDLKADFMRWVGSLPADAKFPDQVIEVLGFEARLEKLKKAGLKGDEPEVKLARKVVGKNGYAVVLGNNGVTKGVFLVTIKDGKARVVAIPQ
jgi:hypothetical protein